jgi:hypothetical protein
MMFFYHRFSFLWHFSSRVIGVPHHSGFMFQNVVLSLRCAMFLARRFFCWECIECYPGIVSRYFLNFFLESRGPSDYRYYEVFHIPHSLNFYYLNVYILIYSQPPLVLHSYHYYYYYYHHHHHHHHHYLITINLSPDTSLASMVNPTTHASQQSRVNNSVLHNIN